MTSKTRPMPSADALARVEKIIASGDLASLSPEERAAHYLDVCASVGLNPLTRPFDFIMLDGKLQLYARKNATDQLRAMHGVSVEVLSRATETGVFTVHVKARASDGRTDEDFGAVSLVQPAMRLDQTGRIVDNPDAGKPLQGQALADRLMHGVTKAKRRVTLSICGLSMLDETEIDDVRSQGGQRDTAQIKPFPRPALRVIEPAGGPPALFADDVPTPDGEPAATDPDPVPAPSAEAAIPGQAQPGTAHDPAADADLRREILLDQIESRLVRRWPNLSGPDKKAKLDMVADHFGGACWTELERVLTVEQLEAGAATMFAALDAEPAPASVAGPGTKRIRTIEVGLTMPATPDRPGPVPAREFNAALAELEGDASAAQVSGALARLAANVVSRARAATNAAPSAEAEANATPERTGKAWKVGERVLGEIAWLMARPAAKGDPARVESAFAAYRDSVARMHPEQRARAEQAKAAALAEAERVAAEKAGKGGAPRAA